MKVILFCIGKTKTQYLEQGLKHYKSRIERYIPFQMEYIKYKKMPKGSSIQQCKEYESSLLLSYIKPDDILILLDEQGTPFSSKDFASKLSSLLSASGAHRLIFGVGGPYGFTQEIKNEATYCMSLSNMTFPHELVRLIFLEQLYRALTINNGEPYHH